MHWKRELIAAAGSLVLALPAFGQTGSSSTGTPPETRETRTSGTSGDADARPTDPSLLAAFLHRVNQDEIETANLAKDRSNNKAVKDYADMIVTDHKKADDQVMSFAKSHNIDLKQAEKDLQAMRETQRERIDDAVRSRELQSPTGEYMRPLNREALTDMASDHKKEIENLSKLKGPEFDRQFAKTMANDHRHVIDRLKFLRSRERNQDVTALIDKLMPDLQKHESMAKQLESTVSRTAG